MELYTEILAHYLSGEQAQILFPNLKLSASQIVEMECYQALQRTKDIISDDALEDAECFAKIEEIICALEKAGSNGGTRHDFG